MQTKSEGSRIHELELMYWDTVIQVLGAWQSIYQPKKENNINPDPDVIHPWLEYIVIALAGLGLGIIIGAISRL